MSDIKRLLDRVWSASDERNRIKGKLGKPDGDGGFTVAVANRPGFVYTRVAREGIQSVTVARNLGNVALRAGLPVEMRLRNGNYVIIGLDSTYHAAATAADDPNEFGITQHTHRIDSGLTYEIEPERFEPGRVMPDTAYQVYANPFRYYYAGAWAYWEGGRIDLESYLPSTSTKWGWILVGLDPSTGALVAVAGAEVASEAALLVADLGDIAFAGYIPLTAIKASEADTDLTTYSRYYDAKEWIGGIVNVFDDSDGDPANVTTATNDPGNSNFAARADHLHGIADGNVTLAKLQEIATDRLLGRDTASAGAVEEITVGGGLEFTGSGGVQRSALTGDVTASAGSGATTIANDAVTNAKLTNMAEATIKGRAAGAGTGDPTDLTGAQVAAIVGTAAGGVLHVDGSSAGNVGTGEDTLATYTLPAATLTTGATLWYELSGTFAANGNTKILHVKFGAYTWYIRSTTTLGDFRGSGRLIATGAATQVTHAGLTIMGVGADAYLSAGSETLSGSIVVEVTGEATADNDIVLSTFVVGYTPAP